MLINLRLLAGMLRIATLLSAPLACAHAAEAPPLTVYAAASLKESLDRVVEKWQVQSGQRVHVSYAASSVLAHQIEGGAPADLLISADAEWMDYLQQHDLIDTASRQDLLGNRLVLIVPADAVLATFDLRSGDAWLTALRGERLALAETVSVPAGRYARAALEQLGVWTALQSRLAQSDNVRAALAIVALGEAPLGIVYLTDARAEPKVKVLADFPPALHMPIVYPVARVSSAPAKRSAGFLDYLRSEEAQNIFVQAGFTIARAAPD